MEVVFVEVVAGEYWVRKGVLDRARIYHNEHVFVGLLPHFGVIDPGVFVRFLPRFRGFLVGLLVELKAPGAGPAAVGSFGHLDASVIRWSGTWGTEVLTL